MSQCSIRLCEAGLHESVLNQTGEVGLHESVLNQVV